MTKKFLPEPRQARTGAPIAAVGAAEHNPHMHEDVKQHAVPGCLDTLGDSQARAPHDARPARSKSKTIPLTAGDGYDRIEWKDDRGRTRSVRATDSASVMDVVPRALARVPKKGKKQAYYHGRYWSHSLEAFVWHESMTEFVAVMLLDHQYELTSIAAQPMLITFGSTGRSHFPDFLLTHTGGRQTLVDVHLAHRTTPEEAETFELTAQLCARVGWRYELHDRLDEVAVWNLEAMNRWSHPRYNPGEATRANILEAVATYVTYGAVTQALTTSRPGELIPALYNLLWHREIEFDLSLPIVDGTPLRLAAPVHNQGEDHVRAA